MPGDTRPDADLPAGKISSRLFDEVIRPSLGRVGVDVLVGPQAGVDVGVVDAGHDRVMAVTCDPLFVMPEYGWQRAAWFAVHIVASDAATSGLRPTYCALDLNLPLDMPDADLTLLWEAIHETCVEIGLAIVTGHTGRYSGCAYPMLGGCTVMSFGGRDEYVTPAMAGVGDAVIITKGAAIEATGQLGVLFPERIAQSAGPEIARTASEMFWQMSVVRDAAVAVEVGTRDRGVTGMHDATERGVWGALVEIAEAAGTGMVVDQSAIPVQPPVAAVCNLFDLDPYSASSEGTLVLTCRPHRAAALLDRFDSQGVLARAIGELTPRGDGVRVARHGREEALLMPDADPFWPALIGALREPIG